MTNVVPLKRPLRAGISARISLSTEESVSIERQLQAEREYCQRRGWTVVAEAVDESVRATQVAPEKRKGLGSLIAQRQDLDVIVGWKVDRLARSTLDFLTMHKLLDADGCALATVEDHIDMTTAQGKAFATILAVFAEMEAAAIAARVSAARTHLFSIGRQPGGRRPWAFDNVPNPKGVGKVLRPNRGRAEAVRAVYEYLLNGGSQRGACKMLDDMGLPPYSRPKGDETPQARRWRTTGLTGMLRSPSLCGARVEHGEIVRNPDGTIAVDEDRAILSLAEWLQLQEILKSAKRGPSSGRTHLLTGLLRCGTCNRVMSCDWTRKVYACTHEHCDRRVSISMKLAEQSYVDAFLSVYGDAHQGITAEPGPDPVLVKQITDELASVQEALRSTRDRVLLLDLFDAQERLEADLAALQDARVSRSRVEPYGAPTGLTWREAYEAATSTEGKNKVLHGIGMPAIVKPGTRGGNPKENAARALERLDFSSWK
jgi:DNA invertase Pin-like site-specific DNA recombinase